MNGFDEYRKPATATQDPFEEFRKPLDTTPGAYPEAALNEGGLGFGERLAYGNLAPNNPQSLVQWLKGRGYEARQTHDGEVVLRKPGGRWKRPEKNGFDFMDVLDWGDEALSMALSGIGMVAGGVAGTGATPGAGTVAGAAAGSAAGSMAAEGLKEGLASAAGFEDQGTLGNLAIEGAVGAVAPVVPLGLARTFGGKEAAKRMVVRMAGRKGEEYVARQAAEEAAQQAAQAPRPKPPVEPSMGSTESTGGQEPFNFSFLDEGKPTVPPAPEAPPPAAPPGAAPEPNWTSSTIPGMESKPPPATSSTAGSAPSIKVPEGTGLPPRAPVDAGPVPEGKGIISQYEREAHRNLASGKLEQLAEKFADGEAAWQAKGGVIKEATIPRMTNTPKALFRKRALGKEAREALVGRTATEGLMMDAIQLGVPKEQAEAMTRDSLEKLIMSRFDEVEDNWIGRAEWFWKQSNDAGMEPMQVEFFRKANPKPVRGGGVADAGTEKAGFRDMVITLNPPSRLAGNLDREAIADWVRGNGAEEVRAAIEKAFGKLGSFAERGPDGKTVWTSGISGEGGVKQARRLAGVLRNKNTGLPLPTEPIESLSGRLKGAARKMSEDELIEHIYKNQRGIFSTNGPAFDPKLWRARIVYDLERQKFSSISADHILAIRKPGQAPVYALDPKMFQVPGARGAIGRAFVKAGQVMGKPAAAVSGLVEKAATRSGLLDEVSPGLQLPLRKAVGMAPIYGASMGLPVLASIPGAVPVGTALAAGQIGGAVSKALGRAIMRDSGSLLSKIVRAPGGKAAAAALQKTLRLEGLEAYRNALLAQVVMDPAIRAAVEE